jgi:Fe-S cluster assembly protein SufD
MSAVPDIRDWYRLEFAGRAPGLAGAALPWLAARRRDAIEQFANHGFPTRKDEDWKYTDVSPLAQHHWRPASVAPVEAAALAPYQYDAYQLVFIDGRYTPTLAPLNSLPDGVRISSLRETLQHDAAALEGRLGRYLGADSDGIAALNLAFAEDGVVIRIARGVDLEKPIQLLCVSTQSEDSIQHLRNLFVLEAGARASVIESHIALAPVGVFTTGITEIELEADAQLTHYRLVQAGNTAWHVDSTYVQQGRASRYAAHTVNLSGRLARHALTCALDGEGAECLINGLYVTRGQAQVDHHTRIEHRQPNTTSRTWVKGVLDEESRGVFSGRVVVHPHAQHSDAAQYNRHLLLSPKAEADSRPQLEIYADDVKCAHGAATGSLDPDQGFYLRSRGLGAEHVRQLLTYAFAADALARLPFTPLRRYLAEQLAGRLLPGAHLEALVS